MTDALTTAHNALANLRSCTETPDFMAVYKTAEIAIYEVATSVAYGETSRGDLLAALSRIQEDRIVYLDKVIGHMADALDGGRRHWSLGPVGKTAATVAR